MKRTVAQIKIIGLIAGSTLCLYLKNRFLLISILSLLFLSVIFIKNRLKIIDRLKSLVPLGMFIFLLQIILNFGKPFFSTISFSILVFTKIAAISVLVFLFVETTSASSIISALFFLPEKAKLIFTMTFHFIPQIMNEAQHIKIVQKSRGTKNGILNIAARIIPLLHRIFIRAEALALTVAARGYE